MKKVMALRGAVQAKNTGKDIGEQVVLLYDKLLAANGLAEENIISVIFSVTGDIDALNPAAALRQSGRAEQPALMVFQEGRFPGSLPETIRVLIHCSLEETAVPRHVYMNGAEALRPDRAASGPARNAPL